MKNNLKRSLIVVICLVVACLGFAACGNNKEKAEQYTVAVSFDSTQGNATLSKPASGERYAKGESVTVTVTPNSGYHVATVTVNGASVTLINSAHTFIVAGNTQINVVFEKGNGELNASVLATAQGSVTFDGTYTAEYDSTLDNVEHNLTVSFREDTVYFYEQDAISGDVLYYYVAANHNGNADFVYHTANNEIAYKTVANPTPFEDVKNPFNKLSVADFTLTQNGVYKLDKDKVAEVASALTGNSEAYDGLTITTDGTNVTFVEITSKDNEINYGSYYVYYDTKTTFELKHYGTGAVPQNATTAYPRESEHAALESALDKASKWNSYTVNYTEASYGEEMSYKIFVTDGAVYCNPLDYENGYLVRSGSLYPFNYDSQKDQVMIGSPVTNINGDDATIRDVRASFGGFKAEMFTYDGENGVYRMRPLDYYVAGETSGASNVIAAAFAELDDIEYALHAVGVEIELRNGDLYKVTVRFRYAGGGVTEVEGTATYSYVNVNNTTIPIDTNNAKTLFQIYKGEYYGKEMDGTVYKLEITDDDFYLTVGDNDPSAANKQIAMSKGEGNYMVIDFIAYDPDAETDRIWHLFTNEGPRGDGFVLFNDLVDAGPWVTMLKEGTEEFDEGVVYPKSFYGSYKGTYYSSDVKYECAIEISASGITITETNLETGESKEFPVYDAAIKYTTMDGITLVLSEEEIDEESGEMVTYYTGYFIVVSLYNNAGDLANIITFHNEDRSFYVSLAREGYEGESFVPERFIGTYEGNGYKIVVGEEKLSITYNGKTDECEYTDVNGIQQVYFTWNGKTYSIYNSYLDNKAEYINLLDEKDDFVVADDIPRTSDSGEIEEPTVTSPVRFIGTYEGSDYKIVIEANRAVVTLGGNEQACSFTRVDGTRQLFFTYNGKEYSIYNNDRDPVNSVDFYDESDNLVATLDRVNQNSGAIDAQYAGTFSGTYQGHEFEFIISTSGITLTIDGVSHNVAITGNIEVNGKPGVAITIDGTTSYKLVFFSANEYTINNAETDNWMFDLAKQ